MSNREISDVIRNKEFVSVSATTLVRDAARLMKKHHTSAVLVIDRKENRHAAFGLGIHRCVGSNLARMEMTVAVEELLKDLEDHAQGEPFADDRTLVMVRRIPA